MWQLNTIVVLRTHARLLAATMLVSTIASAYIWRMAMRRLSKERARDDCWIGNIITFLPGVIIDRSSTVGACSIVCKVSLIPPRLVIQPAEEVLENVPPCTVVYGDWWGRIGNGCQGLLDPPRITHLVSKECLRAESNFKICMNST